MTAMGWTHSGHGGLEVRGIVVWRRRMRRRWWYYWSGRDLGQSGSCQAAARSFLRRRCSHNVIGRTRRCPGCGHHITQCFGVAMQHSIRPWCFWRDGARPHRAILCIRKPLPGVDSAECSRMTPRPCSAPGPQPLRRLATTASLHHPRPLHSASATATVTATATPPPLRLRYSIDTMASSSAPLL